VHRHLRPVGLRRIKDRRKQQHGRVVQGRKLCPLGGRRTERRSRRHLARLHSSRGSRGRIYQVLWDMLKGFIIALVVIFVILSFNFGSAKWAAIGYIPLLFTILIIYGVVGFMGKDFDMPIAVLSCLSLGMAVDFSIHFISRLRQRLSEEGPAGTPSNESLTDALLWTAARPGKGIMRNAVLFASAFSVMLFAPLTPYITVGAFIVSMMLLSAVLTIICLPALIVLFRSRLFGGN